MLADFRFAFRALAKSPGFTLIAVLCVALGIGANTTVFSAVNTLLLRPLPFHDADRVLALRTIIERTGEDGENFSYPEYQDWGTLGGALTATGAFSNRTVNLGGVDEPERVNGSRVTASLFPMLGLRTMLGRGIRPEEEADAHVVVISEPLWRRRFGADRGVVGRTVTINGTPHTVVGVMQRGIRFPEKADLWLPLAPGEARSERSWRQYGVLGRIAPGVTAAQVSAQAAAVSRRLAAQYPESSAGRLGRAAPFDEDVDREVRPIMLVMLGAVGFVLLIACANVANLLLARGTARQREIAVRLAIGASRGRIVRQLLAESVLLAAAGGALGALIGTWGIRLIADALPADDLPFWMVFDVDRTVLALTALASLAAAVLFGLLPALQVSSPDLSGALKEGGTRGASAGARTGRARSSLVVAQLALSLVLLTGASLMMRSFLLLQRASPGFDPSHALTLETSLQGARYAADSAVVGGYEELERRLAALPGVARVGATSQLPVRACCSGTGYVAEGHRYAVGATPDALHSAVTPGYFAALGVPLLEGRGIDARDDAGAPAVAVVNRAMARREWPGESAVGKRFRYAATDSTAITVVGVVGDVKQDELTDRDRPQMYRPNAQQPYRTLALVVRAHGDPAALAPAARQALRAFDKDLPVSEMFTMREVVRRRMFQPRIYGSMFAVFAGAALLLASVGLYGVVAYTVAQRTHEIGVRVALGATMAHVLRLVVRQGARLVALGLLIGVPAALALTRLLRGALYGVSPGDPATFVGMTMLLSAVALLASYVPARRATRVDPMTALRSD